MFCKISLSHPSQYLLLCCITGKTAFALDCTFPASWGHKMPRKSVLGLLVHLRTFKWWLTHHCHKHLKQEPSSSPLGPVLGWDGDSASGDSPCAHKPPKVPLIWETKPHRGALVLPGVWMGKPAADLQWVGRTQDISNLMSPR